MKSAHHHQAHDFANLHSSPMAVGLEDLQQLHMQVIRNGVPLHVTLATAV